MATNIRKMVTLTDADTTYSLSSLLTAAGFTGLPAFRSLSYFTPGSDYAVPNTGNVSIGESGLTDVEDGLLIGPGIRWDDPPLSGSQSYYNPSEIGLRSASAGQRVLIMGVAVA